MILSHAIEHMTPWNRMPFPDFVIAVLGMFVAPQAKIRNMARHDRAVNSRTTPTQGKPYALR